MNIENYQFLVDTLERHGMSHPRINENLKTKMQLNSDEFELKGIVRKFGNDTMQFAPKFVKGDSKFAEPRYYLNKIKATLTKENGKSVTSEFSLYKQRGFNTNEMYNLLSGRPVYKVPKNEEGRWTKVDFSSPDENGQVRVRNYYDSTTNFSLTREIGKLPITWASQQEKEETLRDLMAGERVSVTVKQDGRAEKLMIGVAPQIGGLELLDKNLEVVKRTNTYAIEMLDDEHLSKVNKVTKVPEGTKELVAKLNENESKQGTGKQRKVS